MGNKSKILLISYSGSILKDWKNNKPNILDNSCNSNNNVIANGEELIFNMEIYKHSLDSYTSYSNKCGISSSYYFVL